MDSVVYAYDLSDTNQGCTDPFIEIACNDDACGGSLQSSMVLNPHDFPEFGGLALLRLGKAPGTPAGAGQVEWLIGDPDCPGYVEDSLEVPFPNGNERCASANLLTPGTYSALTVHLADRDFYEIALQDQEILTADTFFSHASGDIDLRLWKACGGALLDEAQSGTDDERISYQNVTGSPLSVWIEVYVAATSPSHCNNYEMLLGITPGTIGSKYCSANANSSGSPADISASGSSSSSAGNLSLEAAPVPDQAGIFFHGANQTQFPFGNGFNCTAGGVKRSSLVFAAGNAASTTYDNSGPRRSLAAHVGSTRNFQYWYRDPAGGGARFNTSNAVAIDVLP
jgi:hypothetical protein